MLALASSPQLSMVMTSPIAPSSSVQRLSTELDAPNVLLHQMPPSALRRARQCFDVAIRPHLQDGLIGTLEDEIVPCASLRHESHGNYFVMRGGSSTDYSKMRSSDLAWISVDDMATWRTFRSIFEDTGLAELVAPLVSPLHRQVQLYSSFYVVRSRCSGANWHADWPVGVGTSAWTLLAPIEEYATEDFHLLYHDSAGEVHQYRYREGEGILFGSHFMHSTEPGQAIGGAAAPHVFLCFTFGSDDMDFYEEHVAPTISGYQSRIVVAADGSERLTEIGSYLQEHQRSEGTVVAEPGRAHELRYSWTIGK